LLSWRGYRARLMLRTNMRDDNLLCFEEEIQADHNRFQHGLPVYPNLLKSVLISGPNQVWASDITYVQLMHEHIYLAVIIDLFSRKCIEWDLSRNMGRQLTMNALDKALKNRWKESVQGLIHHSDQHVQKR
jgi:putative transposase